MKEKIDQSVQVLVGTVLWSAGRVGSLEWFHFGDRRTVVDSHGEPKLVGEYALHVQCAWRVVGPSGIMVASSDRYYPRGDPEEYGSDFQWDKAGENRCDERMAATVAEWADRPPVVEHARSDAVGDLVLTLSQGFLLELFPDDSLEGEHWRLFQPYTEAEHLVVTGSGVESC